LIDRQLWGYFMLPQSTCDTRAKPSSLYAAQHIVGGIERIVGEVHSEPTRVAEYADFLSIAGNLARAANG
jgi:hypothetical protein